MSIRHATTLILALGCLSSTAVQAADAVNTTSATGGFVLRVNVPVRCALKHDGSTAGTAGNVYRLGELKEYCNAPNGYAVVIDYQPGTMRGAVIMVGDERITLDGSGESVVSRATGPRIRSRAILAIPGPAGFDTDRLSFNISMA